MGSGVSVLISKSDRVMKYLYPCVAVQLFIATAYADTNIPNCPAEGIRHHCFAELTEPSSGKYAGQWRSGQYAGIGTYFAPNGDRYVGQFSANQYNGQGIYYFLSGERYVGEFRNGKKHGHGILYSAEGSLLIEGNWDQNIYLSPARNLKDPGYIAQEWKSHIQKEIEALQQKPQPSRLWLEIISKAVGNSLDRWLQDDSGLNTSEVPPPKLPPAVFVIQEKWESDKEYADRLAGLQLLQQKEIEQIQEKNIKLIEQRNKNIRIINETKLAKLQIFSSVSREFTQQALAVLVLNINLGSADFDPKTVLLYLNLGIGGQPQVKYEFKDASLELRKIALTDTKSLWFYPDTFVNADGLFGVKGIKIASGDSSAYGVPVATNVDNQSPKLFGIDLTKYGVKKTITPHKLQDQPLMQPEIPLGAQPTFDISDKTIVTVETLLPVETKFMEEKSLRKQMSETEQRRQEQIRRLKGLGEASHGPVDKANLANSFEPSGTYLRRMRLRVKPNIVFPDQLLQTVKGNPEAEVEVSCSASGEILNKRLTRSSGHSAWDEAVMNAIEKTGKLPHDENGNMPQKVIFTFRPRD